MTSRTGGSGTETQETNASITILATVPFERRVTTLLDAMERSSLFIEEERANLRSARARMGTLPARALAGVLYQVQSTIRRFGAEQADDQLFDWEEAIRRLLLEVLPQGSTMEAYLADFKAQVVAATRLQQEMTDLHNQSEGDVEELYRRFNEENSRIDAGSADLRNRLTGVQASRIERVDEITRNILGTSARGQSMMQRQIDHTEQALDEFDRSINNEQQRLALLTEAIDAVKGIR